MRGFDLIAIQDVKSDTNSRAIANDDQGVGAGGLYWQMSPPAAAEKVNRIALSIDWASSLSMVIRYNRIAKISREAAQH